MKSVLISTRPQWCEKIARGEKTDEVRKTRPKSGPPFKAFIYCTDTKPFLVWGDVFRGNWETEFTHISGYNRKDAEKIWDVFNGKVIGEFVCDRITEYPHRLTTFKDTKIASYISPAEVAATGLTIAELNDYLQGGKAYFWHISNLVIYDEPRPLSAFYKCGAESMDELSDREELCQYCSDTGYGKYATYGSPNGPVMCEGRFCDKAYQEYLDENFALTRPPQSWCYVKEVQT